MLSEVMRAAWYRMLTFTVQSILCIPVNNQLGAQLFFSYIFIPILYTFRTPLCSSSGESIVSIRYLVYVTLRRWTSSVQVWIEPVPSKPAHQTVTYIERHIPDVVLIQLILLMMSTGVLETCRELEYIRKNNCASSWLFIKNYHK